MIFLISVFQSVFLRKGSRALETEIVRCDRGHGLTVAVCRCLWHNGSRIEDATKNHLIVGYGRVHGLCAL